MICCRKCGTPVAYVGAWEVECANICCELYVPEPEPEAPPPPKDIIEEVAEGWSSYSELKRARIRPLCNAWHASAGRPKDRAHLERAMRRILAS